MPENIQCVFFSLVAHITKPFDPCKRRTRHVSIKQNVVFRRIMFFLFLYAIRIRDIEWIEEVWRGQHHQRYERVDSNHESKGAADAVVDRSIALVRATRQS